jgi:hypothetical protein
MDVCVCVCGGGRVSGGRNMLNCLNWVPQSAHTRPGQGPSPRHCSSAPTHLRALLRRQRKRLARRQQRLLPPSRLAGQQVAGQLGVDYTRVQAVGCGGAQGGGREGAGSWLRRGKGKGRMRVRGNVSACSNKKWGGGGGRVGRRYSEFW